MTPDEIKAKAAELAALYTAKANGRTLQIQHGQNEWMDSDLIYGPTIGSDLSRWRVKPEPRRMWSTGIGTTFDEAEADEWRVKGYKVTEWMEVLP
jgi:hypothetical protein